MVDYQVNIIVPYDSDMQADFDDIRFRAADGRTELSYWLESKTDSTTASFWVKVPWIANIDTIIYMYYGNASVTSNSNGANTFTFFDDFTGSTLDAAKWTSSKWGSATLTISGGLASLYSPTGNANNQYIRSVPTFNVPSILETRYKQNGTRYYGQIGFATSTASNFSMGGNYTGQMIAGGYSQPSLLTTQVGNANFASSETAATYYRSTIIMAGASQEVKLNGTSMGTRTDTMPSGTYRIHIDEVSPYNAAYQLDVDWVAIRKYYATTPTYSLESEEVAPDGITSGCSANLTVPVVNGTCGTANTHGYQATSEIDTSAERCATGTFTSFTDNGSSWSWACNGSGGGTNASCSSNKVACGTYHNTIRAAQPASNLCAYGSNTSVTLTGTTWNWNCTNSPGVDAACYTYKTTCGSSNGLSLSSAPSANLCATNGGTASSVTTNSTTYTWTCTGADSTPVSCSANRAGTASCGSSNGGNFSSAPSTNLCTLGGASAVSGSGPWTWTCTLASEYTKRKPITLTNSGSALTDYQVNVTVAYDSDMQADFDDIRFRSSDGTTDLSYWLESKTNSSTASFWVKVPSVPNGSSTIYVYYGNASATSDSSGDDTFQFFENFEGVAVGSIGDWTLEKTGNFNVAQTVNAFQDISTNTTRVVKVLAQNSGSWAGWLYTWARWDISLPSSDYIFQGQYASNYTNGSYWKISTQIDTVEKNGGAAASTAWTNFSYNLLGQTVTSIRAGSYDYQNTGGHETLYDNLIIRKYAASVPTNSFGSEESVTSTVANCSANLITNGSCGTANTHGYQATSEIDTAAERCAAGTFTSFTDNGSSWSWACNGIGGGTNASCSSNKVACGTYHNTVRRDQPASNLCSYGSNTTVNLVTTTWFWNCTNSPGVDAACYTYKTTCGSSNGSTFSSAPSTNLCATNGGTASSVTTNATTYTWTCTGADSLAVSCSANRVVNGACGAANRTYAQSETVWGAYPFCDTGNASPASPTFPAIGASTTWTCTGINGGTTSGTCTAAHAQNGTCGTANRTYLYSDTVWGAYTFCGVGSPTPGSPVFPAQGSSTTWTCSGVNGGTASGTCTASRPFAPVTGTCGTAVRTFAQAETVWGSYTFCGLAGSTPTPASPTFPAAGATTTWTCSGLYGGASSGTCSAYRANVQTGTCGTASRTYAQADSAWGAYTFCGLTGSTPTPASPTFPAAGGSTTWTCSGIDGGGSSGTCTGTHAQNGTCGTANTHGYYSTSEIDTAAERCATGTFTSFTDNGSSWSWACNSSTGGTNASCSSNKASCGTYHNTIRAAQPSSNLCAYGTNTSVTLVSTTWYWNCTNSPGVDAACYTYKTTCGSSNGANFATPPSTNLCATNGGTASSVTTNATTYTWTCTGADSTPVSCTANRTLNGTCGTAVRAYAYSDTTWGAYTQCSVGTPSSTTFPVSGGSVTWTCSGVSGGSVSGNCTATRAATPQNGDCGSAVRTYAEGDTAWGAYNQCDVGTPSSTTFPAAGGSTTWTCSGVDGGNPSGNCTALRSQAGQCGTANRAYAYSDTVWGAYTFCALAGSTSTPASPTFPTAGGSTTWTCSGLNGGAASGTCTATRLNGPSATLLKAPADINSNESCWYCTHYYTNPVDPSTITAGKSARLEFKFTYTDSNPAATIAYYKFALDDTDGTAPPAGGLIETDWIPTSGAVNTEILYNNVYVKNSPSVSGQIAYNTTYYWWVKVKNNSSQESAWTKYPQPVTTATHHFPIVRIAADKSIATVGSDIRYCSTVSTLPDGSANTADPCYPICWTPGTGAPVLDADDTRWKCSICYNATTNAPVFCGTGTGTGNNTFLWAMPTGGTLQGSTNTSSLNTVVQYDTTNASLKPRLKITGSDCSGEGEGTSSIPPLPEWKEVSGQ